jgi:hypothetical protein
LEIKELEPQYDVQVVEEAAHIDLIIDSFPTSPHFNRPTTALLIRVPRSYPDAGPDMFWTDVELLLSDSTMPKNGESVESYCGKQWRRFSWHHNGWNPALNNLVTYITFIRRRFDEK